MFWSAVFVFVLGPMSVMTLPTTTEASTDPPAVTNPTVSSVPLPPGELELILDTLLTQVDRHNTWLETLQDDVYSLGDAVEMHSLDLQKLKKKFHEIHKDKKSSQHSSEESIESDDYLIDSLSLDDLSSWDESQSESSQDSSNAVYDEEDLELFKEKEKEFIEKYRTPGNKKGKGKKKGGQKKSGNDESEEEEKTEEEETEEEEKTEEEETEEEEETKRHGWYNKRGRGNYWQEDVDNTEESSSQSDESHDHS